jgi:hypothetical protein
MRDKPHAIVLRVQVTGDGDHAWITDALGECARDLEAHEADGESPRLGLIHDDDDPGRFAWEIVAEVYSP